MESCYFEVLIKSICKTVLYLPCATWKSTRQHEQGRSYILIGGCLAPHKIWKTVLMFKFSPYLHHTWPNFMYPPPICSSFTTEHEAHGNERWSLLLLCAKEDTRKSNSLPCASSKAHDKVFEKKLILPFHFFLLSTYCPWYSIFNFGIFFVFLLYTVILFNWMNFLGISQIWIASVLNNGI